MPKDKPEVGGFEQGPPMSGSSEPEMGDDSLDMESPGMETGGEEQNPFDHNFDAGVEADENSNPKRFIQQLSGKLSQSLRDYNKKNGQSDSDLIKYALNMIAAQADGLTPEDKEDVIEKLNGAAEGEETPEMNEPEQPMGSEMPMESRRRFVKVNEQQLKYIKENFGGVMDEPKEPRTEKEISPDVRRGMKTKPYIAPSFR